MAILNKKSILVDRFFVKDTNYSVVLFSLSNKHKGFWNNNQHTVRNIFLPATSTHSSFSLTTHASEIGATIITATSATEVTASESS